MASAVDEVSKLLGLSQSSDSVPDDLKSPEQHQASMFAARQQLQAKQKGDSSSFPAPGTSPGVKKVAAIKPQFKTLSKKASFVTPFIKKDSDGGKDSPQKLSPQKKPTLKQLDKLREPASPGEIGRQLPTVSSRYHSPSLKRSRGRHQDETILSDEEIQKSKLLKKSFTSPERKPFSPKSSPRLSPKTTPKLSPKICSPKTRSAPSTTEEVDRQKVNDFFSNKFGLSFSTPKGADRPKPLLKFSRKDESDADYSTVQSPGKFKSTFRALGNDKAEDDNARKEEGVKVEKKKKVQEEKKSQKIDAQKSSGKVEKKTKRKIERSPKRPKKEEIKKRMPSISSSSSNSSSSSEESDLEPVDCVKKSRATKPVAKPAPVQRKQKNSKEQQIINRKEQQINSKEQQIKLKEQKMKDELSRKRKKVYSSSETSESENEFTLSCTNSDNTESIWVQCEVCNKWRYLRDTLDPNLIPDNWICSLNPDKKRNNCNAAEEQWGQLEQGYEFVYSAYSLGSLVWCKMQGYPWWPGMIDNDPLTKTFYYKHANSALPDKYHVTFFGIHATRAWIGKKLIKVYNPDDKEDQLKYDERKSAKGMREAIAMANQAFHLELNDRKKIYGFREQYKSVEDAPVSSSSSKAKGGRGRGRGRPRKNPTSVEKPTKRIKSAKRSSEEQSYIPSTSRLNSLDVIENIENEINQVLRDCSPSPTSFH